MAAVGAQTTETTAPKKPRREFTREIRVKLTESEITDRGRQLATKREEHAALDGDRKATAKSFGGRLAQITAQLDNLTMAISTGKETRVVTVYEERVGNVFEIRRADNDEVIDTRAPNIAEQQADLHVASAAAQAAHPAGRGRG